MAGRFAILGAGVIGLLTARALLQRGHQVFLVDSAAPARAASWAGGGIVSPLYPWRYDEAVSVLADGAQQAHARLAAALRAETGIDPEYNPCGLLMLAPADIDDALAWCRRRRRHVICYDTDGLAAVQPGLASGVASGLWFPDIGNVRNPRLLRALLAAVQSHPRATVRWRATVSLREAAGDAVLAVDGDDVPCDAVIVTAGAWTSDLLRPFGVALPVAPVRGQMLLYPPQPGVLRRIVLKDGRYLIPRRDGRIVCGSTLEYTGFDASTTRDAFLQLRESAAGMLPALAQVAPEAQWAGLRPGAPSGIPYIDRVPGTKLFVNAGHFRNGLVLAPRAVDLGVAMVLGEAPPVDPSPYALGAPRGTEFN